MKRFWLLFFSLFVVLSSWENQLTAANLIDNGPIPEQSIRLRIIANSDSFQDQWLKREVRDAIIEQMEIWVTELDNFSDAQQKVSVHLPELQAVVEQTIRDRGFDYAAEVDFGQVAFPTKMYGSYVYPAGEYEALRIRIGAAQGENWWCVLFPPLCFIDMANGDAVQTETTSTNTTAIDTTETDIKQDDSLAAINSHVIDDEQTSHSAPQVQVRFFLWDKLVSLFS